MFFGICKYIETEWANILLRELESMTGPGGAKVERDRFFKSVRMSQIPDLKITARW